MIKRSDISELKNILCNDSKYLIRYRDKLVFDKIVKTKSEKEFYKMIK